jgi:hypothetical protein
MDGDGFCWAMAVPAAKRASNAGRERRGDDILNTLMRGESALPFSNARIAPAIASAEPHKHQDNSSTFTKAC